MVTTPYTGQAYQVLYASIDDNLLTEVQSINVVMSDGGTDISTLVRDYGGRVKGSAKATCTLRGVIPYMPTDVGGQGFSSGGMLTGGGVQLDATMLTNLNQNNNKPIKFTIQIGQPAAQKLFFKGYISQLTVDVSNSKQADWSIECSGSFASWQ